MFFTPATPYRFVPNTTELIYLEGRNFIWRDLKTGQDARKLTDLKGTFQVQNFDISPDGKQIVFAHWQDNADVVLMHLDE